MRLGVLAAQKATCQASMLTHGLWLSQCCTGMAAHPHGPITKSPERCTAVHPVPCPALMPNGAAFHVTLTPPRPGIQAACGCYHVRRIPFASTSASRSSCSWPAAGQTPTRLASMQPPQTQPHL